ncbi:MAG: sterol desaturase family protein [Actinomycetota bacterium]|nr:sterol desaturase family protein [Actinomycetota bacterium]
MLTRHIPITMYAIPFYAVAIAVELATLGRARRGARSGSRARPVGYRPADTAASLSMGVGSLVVGLAIAAVDVPISLLAWHHRLVDLGTGAVGWATALVAWDFSYYWNHRAGHRIRLLWANHVQHHSSRHYNLSTALRQPVTSFNEWLFFPTLCLFGLQPWLVFAAGGINLVYQFWIHTEAIGHLPRPVEAVLNTPSHHRVHHGANRRYLDRNYGGILIVWDRLFGTFEAEREPVVYGLTTNIATFNPLRIATHEYASLARDMARTPNRWLAVQRLVRPPGWEPAPVGP